MVHSRLDFPSSMADFYFSRGQNRYSSAEPMITTERWAKKRMPRPRWTGHPAAFPRSRIENDIRDEWHLWSCSILGIIRKTLNDREKAQFGKVSGITGKANERAKVASMLVQPQVGNELHLMLDSCRMDAYRWREYVFQICRIRSQRSMAKINTDFTFGAIKSWLLCLASQDLSKVKPVVPKPTEAKEAIITKKTN